MPNPDPLVTVATFPSLMQAELARGVLAEKGISSSVIDAESANTFSGATGAIKLQVHKSNFLAAERLLNNRRSKARAWNIDDYGLPKSKAITAAPGIVREQAEDSKNEPDDENAEESEADRTVDRAMHAAIFGLVLFPPLLHFYSLWLLFQLRTIKSRVSPVKFLKLYGTIAFDLIVIVAAAVIGQFTCMAPRYW